METKDSRARILIVDDDEKNIKLLRIMLGDTYDIDTATNGREGVEKALEVIPDIILLDIMMPEMDGYAACRAIREEKSLKMVKIILLSAKAFLKDRLDGYEAGADDYLSKPFEESELHSKIRVFWRLVQTEKRLRDWNTDLEMEVARRTSEQYAILVTNAVSGLPNANQLDIDLRKKKGFRLYMLKMNSYDEMLCAFGTEMADRLICLVSKKLADLLTENDQLYHYRTDEFAIISYEKTNSPDQFFYSFVEKVSTEAIQLGNISVNIVFSGSAADDSAANILNNAYLALLSANIRGPMSFVEYTPDSEMEKNIVSNLSWSYRIGKGINENLIVPYYQGIRNN